MKKIFIKNKIWEDRRITYSEWGSMKYDWNNEYKLSKCLPAYFFRVDNYKKGLVNPHIMRSTFGRQSELEIKKEISNWFNKCVGAYTEIEYRETNKIKIFIIRIIKFIKKLNPRKQYKKC